MKEATGELNMTVITVVAIAAVAAFFYAFIWPAIKNTLNRTTLCNSASCESCTLNGNRRTCTNCTITEGDNGTPRNIGTCVFTEDQSASGGGGTPS